MATAYGQVFIKLGQKYRALRLKRDMVQEDVIEYGFSVRHYQQLEAGRPHSLATLFRLAEMFQVKPELLIQGLFKVKPHVPKKFANLKR
jgi:transcriptional regulator with XRE-family HTH domain